MGFFKDLIRNNSGVSSKSFFLVTVTAIGLFLLLIVAFILIWDVVKNGQVCTDLSGLSLFVGSITSLFTAAGLTKCIGEKHEYKNNHEKELDA